MSKQNKRHRRIRKHRAGTKGTKRTNFPGQHLMHNKRLIADLIGMADITPEDVVLEIGAGTGALTLPLAKKAAKVLAVENDPHFANKLRRATEDSNIHVIERNFLEIGLPRQPFCVVANIPYSITTPILGKLLDRPTNSLQRAVLVVEKGAAIRFTATPITDPRILTWRMWFHLERGRSISPNNFSPPPRVDSAVLVIRRKETPPIDARHHRQFAALAAYGLTAPHAPLHMALDGVFTPPQVTRLVRQLDVAQEAPIGTLNERQWRIVFQTMQTHVTRFRWPKIYKRK
ncbi:23S ribosomal RNA methyltransferase Erm [Numidum massiliense]|uniref:23S ribosomal RNA methyltransferase Erm n=1 Tax=Numidum massiliense TaxID=1522315 RepID=UPI0006D59168|nr:23S ribosomal RNA methyltransferase Erm [Numidum massiliense]